MKGKNDGCVKVSRGGCRANSGITSQVLLQSQDLIDRMPCGLMGNRNILLRTENSTLSVSCPFLMTTWFVDVFFFFFFFLQKLLCTRAHSATLTALFEFILKRCLFSTLFKSGLVFFFCFLSRFWFHHQNT